MVELSAQPIDFLRVPDLDFLDLAVKLRALRHDFHLPGLNGLTAALHGQTFSMQPGGMFEGAGLHALGMRESTFLHPLLRSNLSIRLRGLMVAGGLRFSRLVRHHRGVTLGLVFVQPRIAQLHDLRALRFECGRHRHRRRALQGFANAESACKTLQAAQDALEAAESSALAQTASIDELCRTMAHYRDMAKSTRLTLEKIVKAQKEKVREDIRRGGVEALAAHIAGLNERLGKPYMPAIPADFAGAMKGKKTIASLRDAVNTTLAHAKIEANQVADRIQLNLNTLRELAKDHGFLFADTAQIVQKQPDDLTALVKARIAEHREAEQKRLDAERERIRQEEEAKARAAAAQPATQAPTPAVAQAPQKPHVVAAAKGPRPTDDDLIKVLALHYRVHESKVIEWLLAMDLAEARKNFAMKQVG